MKKTFFFIVMVLVIGSTVQAQQPKSEAKTTSKVQHITYKDFIEKIWDFEKNPDNFIYKGKTMAVVDFYADWCGPCRRVGPIMEELADDYEGEVVFYKVNVDQEKELSSVFQVRSIPMVLFIPLKGQPAKQIGALPEAEYARIIEAMLDGEEDK